MEKGFIHIIPHYKRKHIFLCCEQSLSTEEIVLVMWMVHGQSFYHFEISQMKFGIETGDFRLNATSRFFLCVTLSEIFFRLLGIKFDIFMSSSLHCFININKSKL